MAGSKGNGNGSTMLRVLREIRNELRNHGQILTRHGERLDFLAKGQIETNTKLADLTAQVSKLNGEMSKLNQRFDNFLTGEHRRDHEELRGRVQRLERETGIGPPPAAE